MKEEKETRCGKAWFKKDSELYGRKTQSTNRLWLALHNHQLSQTMNHIHPTSLVFNSSETLQPDA